MKRKHLFVHRETLRSLTALELTEAAGGIVTRNSCTQICPVREAAAPDSRRSPPDVI